MSSNNSVNVIVIDESQDESAPTNPNSLRHQASSASSIQTSRTSSTRESGSTQSQLQSSRNGNLITLLRTLNRVAQGEASVHSAPTRASSSSVSPAQSIQSEPIRAISRLEASVWLAQAEAVPPQSTQTASSIHATTPAQSTRSAASPPEQDNTPPPPPPAEVPATAGVSQLAAADDHEPPPPAGESSSSSSSPSGPSGGIRQPAFAGAAAWIVVVFNLILTVLVGLYTNNCLYGHIYDVQTARHVILLVWLVILAYRIWPGNGLDSYFRLPDSPTSTSTLVSVFYIMVMLCFFPDKILDVLQKGDAGIVYADVGIKCKPPFIPPKTLFKLFIAFNSVTGFIGFMWFIAALASICNK